MTCLESDFYALHQKLSQPSKLRVNRCLGPLFCNSCVCLNFKDNDCIKGGTDIGRSTGLLATLDFGTIFFLIQAVLEKKEGPNNRLALTSPPPPSPLDQPLTDPNTENGSRFDLCICVCITIDTMLNSELNADVLHKCREHTNVRCERTLSPTIRELYP